MEWEVAYDAFVGDDNGFLESVHPLSDINVDVVTRVSNGEEGVFNDHLVRDVFEMNRHVLGDGHWVVEVVVDDVCRQVAEPFAGVGYDGVEMDIKVEKSDCWVSRIAVVGEFVATDCQENAVRFSL